MIIGVTGHARNGKDSLANMLVASYGFTKMAFADGVRQLALAIDPFVNIDRNTHFTVGDTPFARYSDVLKICGYETAKGYADVRRLLQRIGTEAVRDLFGENAWVNLLAERIYQMRVDLTDDTSMGLRDVNVVLSDVRFPNEADFIAAQGGIVVRVVRPGYEGADAHASERGVESITPDITLTAVDLDELKWEVDEMMDLRIPRLLATRLEAFNTGCAALPRATRVYLAAPWAQKMEASIAKQRLIAAGLDVVSGWTERENTPAEIAPERMREQAELDRDEVNVADVLVILGLSKSEGKATEMGMALARGKRVILVKSDCVGNIFYNLPNVQRVDTLDEAIGLVLAGPNSSYIRVTQNANGDKVDVVTGDIVATWLGTVLSATADGIVARTVAPPEEFKFELHSVGDGIKPNRLGVITDIAPDYAMNTSGLTDDEIDLVRHSGESGKD